MDHPIITTDARELLTHWTESSVIETSDDISNSMNHDGGHGTANSSSEDLSGTRQRSRRSVTEAERGLKAEPNALRPPTTKAGKHRIRMKWSNEVNEFIMRTYYTITSNETVSNYLGQESPCTKTKSQFLPFQQTKAYRDSLHKLFAQQYPDVAISQQRIADQRRAIVKNNLLPKSVLDAIREEVAQSLQLATSGTIIKQEPVAMTITSTSNSHHHIHHHQVPMKTAIVSHVNLSHHQNLHHQQQQQNHHQPPPPQQQQQAQQHHLHIHQQQQHQQQSHLSTPIHIQTTTAGHHTRIHQASPTTAAALQNQPHIIIRVNSTNANGALKHHFIDDGSSI